MAAVGEEISPESRLLLIELFEGLAEGVRRNDIRFSEGSARALGHWAESIIHPEKSKMEDESIWKNITEACDYIGRITPQTYRKYVREGKIPQGRKRRGYHEPVWPKEEIEAFREWYDSHRRKGIKS
ncbi:MAG: hypothetical protein J6X59_00365 [Bacteroidales bacterium]|nr:hypothetical protein [Bacteroidales bacterium]